MAVVSNGGVRVVMAVASHDEFSGGCGGGSDKVVVWGSGGD